MEDHVLGIMGIPTCRPKPGYYKLNFDGSAKDNVSAGGGFIWDSNGNLVATFSAY